MNAPILLLADPSPCLRHLALREFFAADAIDSERLELVDLLPTDGLVVDLLRMQSRDGSWGAAELGARGTINRVRATSLALARLGYLGFASDHAAVRAGADYLFARQRKDGAWSLPRIQCKRVLDSGKNGDDDADEGGGYTMVPLQTALPLHGLVMNGLATDPRCERAYDWLLAQRLEDGAWPTGTAAGNHGFVAGYRRLAHSRWGCRSNTTGALACLAMHPERRHAPATKRALDLLLGRETRDQHGLGLQVSRLLGAQPARGFFTYYARFDIAQILDLCWRIGATVDDERVGGLVEFVRSLQGDLGQWRCSVQPQASSWLSFDLLRSMSRLDESGDWLSSEPRTPFQTYPRPRRRY
jgi:hypothetical protein